MVSRKNHTTEEGNHVSGDDNVNTTPPNTNVGIEGGVEVSSGASDSAELELVIEHVDSDLSEAYKIAFTETETDGWNVDKWILRTLPEVLIVITESVAYPLRWLDVEHDNLVELLHEKNSVERRNTAADLLEVAALLKGWATILNNEIPYTPTGNLPGQELAQIVTETWNEKGRDALRRVPQILNTPHIAPKELVSFRKWMGVCGEKLYSLGDRGHGVPSLWENLAGEKVGLGLDHSVSYNNEEELARLQEVGDVWNGELKTVGEQFIAFAETGNFNNLPQLFHWVSVNVERLWD